MHKNISRGGKCPLLPMPTGAHDEGSLGTERTFVRLYMRHQLYNYSLNMLMFRPENPRYNEKGTTVQTNLLTYYGTISESQK